MTIHIQPNFIHKPVGNAFQAIERISKNYKRYYVTPEGKKYPSVTTILATQPKPGIQEWKKRVGQEEADRIINDAVTRGHILHSTIEEYLGNNPEFMPTPFEHVTAEYCVRNRKLFKGLKSILDTINNIHGLEIHLWSDTFKWAGTADCIAELEGILSIIDFKTASSPKPDIWLEDYFMQAFAYMTMFEERTGVIVPQIVLLIANDKYPYMPQVVRRTRKEGKEYVKKLLTIYKESGLK